ncbi:hypothetical protein [Flavobacterium piscinae]|uniref:hypothetical protein n=1 Tax=Flavobacterium piscinae TaxID=2506424 RepID=UPI002AABA7A3|nr:hypothetical protein [Flavobacterium piscinae]
MQNRLYENIVTVVRNKASIIPIKNLEKDKIAYVKLGDDSNGVFLEMLKNYAEVTEISNSNLDSLLTDLSDYSKVIISYHKADGAWKKHDLSSEEIQK